MERGAALFGKATFAMDRGYDDNKMFLKLDELEQDYVIRLTAKRKLFFHGKQIPATQLRNQRKGKIKTVLTYKGKKHDAYLSHMKVQITASKKDIYLVLVYGITEHPMMLATNKKIQSKEDVVNIALTYFSRWRIEEYFRCKKQMFQFGFITKYMNFSRYYSGAFGPNIICINIRFLKALQPSCHSSLDSTGYYHVIHTNINRKWS